MLQNTCGGEKMNEVSPNHHKGGETTFKTVCGSEWANVETLHHVDNIMQVGRPFQP